MRTFKDKHGVVHRVYVRRAFAVGARPKYRYENWLCCTNENLYHLRVSNKNRAVTCLECLCYDA